MGLLNGFSLNSKTINGSGGDSTVRYFYLYGDEEDAITAGYIANIDYSGSSSSTLEKRATSIYGFAEEEDNAESTNFGFVAKSRIYLGDISTLYVELDLDTPNGSLVTDYFIFGLSSTERIQTVPTNDTILSLCDIAFERAISLTGERLLLELDVSAIDDGYLIFGGACNKAGTPTPTHYTEYEVFKIFGKIG